MEAEEEKGASVTRQDRDCFSLGTNPGCFSR